VVAPTDVGDADVAQFASRIEHFYGLLEGVPLDAVSTYQNADLRSCFSSQSAFADYFSALATAEREKYFRDGVARRVTIREFHFESADLALVDIDVRGVHERVLRFWPIGFARHDTWKRVDGAWVIAPDKL
jgi:hypothetical protein